MPDSPTSEENIYPPPIKKCRIGFKLALIIQFATLLALIVKAKSVAVALIGKAKSVAVALIVKAKSVAVALNSYSQKCRNGFK